MAKHLSGFYKELTAEGSHIYTTTNYSFAFWIKLTGHSPFTPNKIVYPTVRKILTYINLHLFNTSYAQNLIIVKN